MTTLRSVGGEGEQGSQHTKQKVSVKRKKGKGEKGETEDRTLREHALAAMRRHFTAQLAFSAICDLFDDSHFPPFPFSVLH